MDVRVTNLCEVPLLELWGDIDHGSCNLFELALDDAMNPGDTTVLLDLSDVTYIDSGGLSVLFSRARRLKEDGWLGLINPNPNVRRLLEIVGVLADPRFRVFDSRETATAALPHESQIS